MALRESFSAKAFLGRRPALSRDGDALHRRALPLPAEHRRRAPDERNNPLRVAVGNGLRADVWEPFQSRFGIPHDPRVLQRDRGARA